MAKDFVTYDEIEIGAKASFSKTISESDVYQFAGITGCLADSLVSTVLGMKYPGRGTIFLEKSVSYVKPVYIGDTITCEITAAEKSEMGRVFFDVSYRNQDGVEVIKGNALVMAPRG